MPATQTAIGILEFGRLLHQERRYTKDRDPSKVQKSEEELIAQLQEDKSPSLKQIFAFNAGKPLDPITLRVLSFVAFVSLCSSRSGIGVHDIVKAVAGEDPATVLETRQVVSRLLIGRQLELHNNCTIELGPPILQYLAGGKQAPPLALTEFDLQRAWHLADEEKKRRKAREPIPFTNMPSAKQLAARIAEQVVGLDAQVRTVACRVAMHIRRAAMIRADQDPGSPNEAVLFIGNSGTGKTFVAEIAGKVCGVPFASVDCNSLTCEGYVGLGVDDALKQLFTAAGNDIERTRYGICFLDELDKKRASGWEQGSRDVAGASVQQGLLRVIEGCEYQIGGRKGSYDWAPMTINTRGMFFAMAGAFNGLGEILRKHGAHGMGFGARPDGSMYQAYLYDALQEFGLIPELLNRLSGVIVFPDPTVEQLIEIATRSVIPCANRLLAAFGVRIEVSGDGVRLMAECALSTKTYARGLKGITAAMIEDLVFETQTGSVQLGVTDVADAMQSAGLAAVAA